MNRTAWLILVPTLLLAAAASADTAWGLRGGVTFDPDQVHVGAHLNAGELFDNGYFLPNIEVGFGDGATLIALNPELVYRFDHRTKSSWGFYAGAGLAINIYSWDGGDDHGDDSNTELGMNILGGMNRGLSSGNELFLELKLGVVDSPDAKITVGITFG
jgi:hypothetical protein